jgi:hypothetical protein
MNFDKSINGLKKLKKVIQKLETKYLSELISIFLVTFNVKKAPYEPPPQMKLFDTKINYFSGQNWFFSLPSKSSDLFFSSLRPGTKK